MICISSCITYNVSIKEVKCWQTLHAIYRSLQSEKNGYRLLISLRDIPKHLLHQVELISLKEADCLAYYSLKDYRTLRMEIITLRPIRKELNIFIRFTDVLNNSTLNT